MCLVYCENCIQVVLADSIQAFENGSRRFPGEMDEGSAFFKTPV
ncbi:hypothetical protein SZ55_1759 [Pseudomonas sp. FeS53a]|nr:hypothetical protein SZ55_1759 [Pseudomonas sp. FeS53a]